MFFAREIHDREKQVADFFRDFACASARDRLFRFGQFFIHFRHHVRESSFQSKFTCAAFFCIFCARINAGSAAATPDR